MANTIFENSNFKKYISEKFIFVESDGKITNSDFYISKYPVMTAELQKILDKNGKELKTEKEYLARATVIEAMKYCNFICRENGFLPTYDVNRGVLINEDGQPVSSISDIKGFRLPTPQEWEYAARGGKPRDGQSFELQVVLDKYFLDGSFCVIDIKREEEYKKGSFDKNSIGICDILGNVVELSGKVSNEKSEFVICYWDTYYTNYDCVVAYCVRGENYKENERVNFRVVINR